MLVRTTRLINQSIITSLLFPYSQGVQSNYRQRPWHPQTWYSLNKEGSLKDSIHGGWLMAKEVLPFSYDGYEWICIKAVHSQAQLSKDDILMMISLGVKYQVRLQPFCKNVENELFLRIHRDYQLDMLDYESQISKQLQEMYVQLEAKSIDFYSLLKEEEDEDVSIENEDQQQSEQKMVLPLKPKQKVVDPTEKVVSDLNDRYINNKKKEFEVKDLVVVADMLRQWGSTNLELLQYIQQLITVKLQGTSVDSKMALSYIQFLTYVCQSLFKEYQQNRTSYTARSLKNIYKYQYFYFFQHFRQLITSDSTASPEFIETLVRQYSSFPIKRRQIRRKIGVYVSSQMKKYEMTHREDLVHLLMDMNKKDSKMKKIYRSLLGLPEPEQPKSITQQSTPEELPDKDEASENK